MHQKTGKRIVLGISSLVYALAVVPIYEAVGGPAYGLAALLVAVAGLLFGLRVGLLFGLLMLPLHALRFAFAGYPVWDVLTPPNALGHSFLAAIGAAAGRLRDLNERVKEQARELRHRTLHDPLTGLPNRALLEDRLGHALARVERSGGRVAVLFVDLDDFKSVNDTFGHDVGDRLLVSVAERLRGCLREADTAARFGGDEFVVLLEDVADAGDAGRVARTIVEALRRPFASEAGGLSVTASVGVVISTDDSPARPGELLRSADSAMYRSKKEGKGRYAFFEPDA